ncbi:MAG TPA: cadmium-translocating P-type ATPase [Ruminococcaceae bacterium]|nr:cadmium-translocating P-type ATPase [Oscillospiraceae bacterium]
MQLGRSVYMKNAKQNCDCSTSPCAVCEEKKDESEKYIPKPDADKIAFIAGALLFVIGMLFPLPKAGKFLIFLSSYILVGGKIIVRAVQHITKGQVFDENFLMGVATVGAFCIGEFAEGVAVMLFYHIGEFLEDKAVDHSRKSISALMDIRPDYANLKTGDEVCKVSPANVNAGDIIIIRPGERVPLDGTVTDGSSFLDTSALTGEPVPHRVGKGSEILSGSVNQNGLLTVKVSKKFGESTVTKILDLVQNATSHKAPTENFITKFAKIYTPAVVFAAVALALIPPLAVPGAHFSDWINRALTFLVVSCPCALVISIPLSFFGGIGGASKKGILIKGSNYLEALSNVDTVVFDKTGTLTKGTFKVTKIQPSSGLSDKQLIYLAAYAELYSNHPIAASIREAYGVKPDSSRVSDYNEISGEGVSVKVDGHEVLAGNKKLMSHFNVSLPDISENGTIVFVAADKAFVGFIIIADEIKGDSKAAINGLKKYSIHTVMLTGDSKPSAEHTAGKLGIDRVCADLLPQQKVEEMEKLESNLPSGKKLVFVGDGINDAPVLARADIGIAMGGAGSDAAIEAADIALMTDEPSKIITAIRISKKTHFIVWQNIVFALAVKIAILVLAAFGLATMWEAVFGDVGVTIIAVLNSIRASHIKEG